MILDYITGIFFVLFMFVRTIHADLSPDTLHGPVTNNTTSNNDFFNRVAELESNLNVDCIEGGHMSTIGESKSLSYYINDETKWLINISWSEGSECKVKLIDPTGKIISEENASAYSGVEFLKEGVNSFFYITSPLSGRWEIITESTIKSQEGTDFALLFQSDSIIKVDYLFAEGEYEIGSSLNPQVQIREGTNPCKGAKVNFFIYDETGTNLVNEFLLLDDGEHDDEEHNDGIYGNVYPLTGTLGKFTCKILIQGMSNGKQFTRSFSSGYEIVKKIK